MINHDLKCIFVHIPRCAGTYVEKVVDGRDWWVYDKARKHLSAEESKERYAEHWDDYYKFAFVRNPWAIEVSWYFWKRSRDVGFKEFIVNEEVNEAAKVSKGMRDRRFEKFWSDHGSCSNWLACGGEIEMDFIGKVENIKSDLATVCAHLGTPVTKRMQWNRTRHKHYSHYYGDETKSIVAKRYENDLTNFGYEYEIL